ncbi:SGNH/GDSL hydrolase family protein [Dyella monticola]|nr:SGNH/GDSL hydrolase family protein [Dyella monticola]
MSSLLKANACSPVNTITFGLIVSGLAVSPMIHAQTQPQPHYVAAGDSYASGTGLSPQKDDSGCGRFVENPSAILSATLNWSDDDRSCGGAKIATGFLQPQFDFPNEHPAQVEALGPDTRYLSMLFGGNDTSYATSLYLCVGSQQSNPEIGEPCKRRYEADIEAGIAVLGDDLSDALDAARQRAPNAKIVVVGYPSIFPENSFECPFSMDDYAGPLTPADINYFTGAMKRINRVLADTARAHGVAFADMDRHFQGHDACKEPAERWIASINVEPGNGWNSALHPNPRGYAEMAEVMKAAFESQ